jgi:asparagine synthase (glutamine-hydrolysing)
MLDAMRHRGPDGKGIWVSRPDENGRGCILGHRRLLVIDGPQQPLVRNGHALVGDASIFSTPQGDDALQGLTNNPDGWLAGCRGMFALALWDQAAGQLLLARDQLGHKPLYVCWSLATAGRPLVFASEIRALIASGLLGRARLDPIGLASMVWNGFVMSPRTMVEGIESLLPGELRVFDKEGRSAGRRAFWTMPCVEPKSDNDLPVQAELHESVRLTLQRHEKARVAVLLSGGVDSSSVANVAGKMIAGDESPIQTFCLSMEEAELSEGDAARGIARAIGAEHHEVMVTERRFVDTLEDALGSLDQPTFDGLNQYQVCRFLRDEGFRIALGGIGGDAIFGGDRTLRDLPRLQRLAAWTDWLPESVRVGAARWVAAMASARRADSRELGPQQGWAKLPEVARARGNLLALYQLTYGLFLPDFQRELLLDAPADLRYGLPGETCEWLGREINGQSAIEAAAILETRCFVGERLLRDADSVSSAVSVELRSPLADPRLVEALSRITPGRKFLPVGRKPLLRRYGLEGVDRRLYDAPKKGFVLPFDRWLRASLGSRMDELMRDSAACEAAGLRGTAVSRLWGAFRKGAPGLYWNRVWAIYVLIRWCHQHGVLR